MTLESVESGPPLDIISMMASSASENVSEYAPMVRENTYRTIMDAIPMTSVRYMRLFRRSVAPRVE